MCKACGSKYTTNPKGYSEETKQLAVKIYLSGVSGRQVGKILGVSPPQAIRWLKKTKPMWISPKTRTEAFELDELFWFISGRKDNEHGINTYIMTMMSRIPRQLVGFAVDKSVNSVAIQGITDSSPAANNYYTEGNFVYCDVVFGGKHRRNTQSKKDTHLIESTNADLRHYIAGLKRRSKCFFRSLETLKAVLNVFCNAYNKFGEAKKTYRQKYPNAKSIPFATVDFI